jgi:hypothetical protein
MAELAFDHHAHFHLSANAKNRPELPIGGTLLTIFGAGLSRYRLTWHARCVVFDVKTILIALKYIFQMAFQDMQRSV